MNLSEVVDKEMKKRRISSLKLEKEISIPNQTISDIRTGRNINPTLKTLMGLADYFEITLDELIGRR